ncbi:MAG: ABC transporter ATP-binding protein [Dehalococcoidales bacterium]|nr:ABC transporter ATP-binding protein [Dehalococcoidales bacterium]
MRALQDVSVLLETDKIYGLLGRNGAGKTTLINIITNQIFADTGEVLVDGEPAEENEHALAKIYCMTEKNVHPTRMKVKDGFRWAAEFYPSFDKDYAFSLAQRFAMDTDKKIHKLSSGYGSIFKLILTLASGVPVMIFDEPVLGLDAAHRELFYRLLLEYYSENGGSVIISTHLIDEVADILEHVIILKEGEMIMSQPVESILHSAYTVSGEISGVDAYCRGRKVIHEDVIGGLKAATLMDERDAGDNQILDQGNLSVSTPRLQEIFISLTGSEGGEN